MSQPTPLRQEIPVRFSEAVETKLGPGESILVSLPGSYGEAFVMTDKRAFVIREHPSGPNPELDVHAYWLTAVSEAHAETQGTGGFIQLGVEEAKSDPDSARVFFPAYDLEKFKAAADMVAMLKQSASPSFVPDLKSGTNEEGNKCLKCGAALPENAAFCSQCGEQLGPICVYCGTASAPGAAYCSGCGNKMLEATTSCPSCGSRTTRWQTYCGECGSVLVVSCAGCGSMIPPSDKHCRACGRLLGTDRVDPRAARAMHARMTAAQQTRSQQDEAGRESTAETTEPAAAASDAEYHNQRGRELFEQEDVEAAINEFKAAVALEPLNASYHCNLAVAYDDADQDELALQEYEKTLELDPKDLTALLSLGYMYNEADEPDKAKHAWDRILQIAPLSAEAQEVQDSLRHQSEL